MAWLLRHRALIAVALLLLFWIAFFLLIPPGTLITYTGVSNAYAISFGISLIAGFSTFTGSAAYATIIEFARSGVNPWYLGIAGGVGLFLSDTAFYLLIMRGRRYLYSMDSRFHVFLERIQDFIQRVPNPIVYFFVFLFCAFGPIPNDLILAVLLIAGYEYRKFWPCLLAGDVALMLFLSHLFA